MKVLVVSASMGAGHDGAARELATRLRARGDEVVVRDFLDALPLGLGPVIRAFYLGQLRFAPWSYDASYKMWFSLPSLIRPLMWLIGALAGRRLRRWSNDAGAEMIVSTYPLASLVLGRERSRGRLAVPAATFVTDFAVHPLWAAPGIDLHLCVHPNSADSAHTRTGAPADAPGPLVPARFRHGLPSRAAARAGFGIGESQRCALLVAGSWGVGSLTAAFDDIQALDGWVPLAVCGNNAGLRRRLEARGTGIVMGWTDEMPALMAAADVLVENAGGLTSMEAFACGLPVVSYRPIAGHGRANAAEMAAAGVAALAHTREELAIALDESLGATGSARARAAEAMFRGDAAEAVHRFGVRRGAPVVPIASRDAAAGSHGRAGRVAVRAGAVGAALVAMTYVSATEGVALAAAHGVAVVRAPDHSTAVYVAVRLGPAALTDPSVAPALARAGVTAIVPGAQAQRYPAAVADLSRHGVEIANGGWGHARGMAWTRAHADVTRSDRVLNHAAGVPIRLFVPGGSIDGWDLANAQDADERVVHPHHVVRTTTVPPLDSGDIYVIDATSLSGSQVLDLLVQLDRQRAATPYLTVAPLSALVARA